MVYQSFEGIVIKRKNYREADRFVTFFTREHGKITLLAKGIRMSTSRRQGTLELFNHIRGSFVTGKGPVPILTETLLITQFSSWKKYFGRLSIAFQLAETIDKLTAEGQSHPQAFVHLLDCFSQIHVLSSAWETQRDRWLASLISELGYGPPENVPVNQIFSYIETISERRLISPNLLDKLK